MILLTMLLAAKSQGRHHLFLNGVYHCAGAYAWGIPTLTLRLTN